MDRVVSRPKETRIKFKMIICINIRVFVWFNKKQYLTNE